MSFLVHNDSTLVSLVYFLHVGFNLYTFHHCLPFPNVTLRAFLVTPGRT